MKLLTPKETADYLGVSIDTLDDWRSKRIGPAFTKLGDGVRSPVRYELDDLIAYVRARKVNGRSGKETT